MSFPKFLKENRPVCPTVDVVSEARNKLSSNKSKVTKNLSVISNICKQIHGEKAKSSKNVRLINGMIQEYFNIKESTYKLVSELLVTSEELNTSLDLMLDSAFIGEAAEDVVRDNKVDAQAIHKKYKDEVESVINGLEREVDIAREEKIMVSVNSRGSSRTNTPEPSGSRNYGKFHYMSSMDPGHLDEGISLNDAYKWLQKFNKFMKSCATNGYSLDQYIDQMDTRLDDYWKAHIGALEEFNFKSKAEVDTHISDIFESVFPLHVRRIGYYMKPKAGKTESRVQVFMDCLKEAERAKAGEVTENASGAMIYLNILGSGPADSKIQGKLIEYLRDDPAATEVATMKKIIQDIEAEVLITGGYNPSILRRTQSRQQSEQPREAETVNKPKQHCQICNRSNHLASDCYFLCKKDKCAKTKWHNMNKCPYKKENKGQASGQSQTSGQNQASGQNSAPRGRSRDRRRGNPNRARRVANANDPEESEFDAPTSGEENEDNRT